MAEICLGVVHEGCRLLQKPSGGVLGEGQGVLIVADVPLIEGRTECGVMVSAEYAGLDEVLPKSAITALCREKLWP